MSCWSTNPDRFAETDFRMEMTERKIEWPLLHGDAMTPTGRLSVEEPKMQNLPVPKKYQ